MRAEFKLPSVIPEDATMDRKAPIRVKFEIPYFTVSGIQVRIIFSLSLIFRYTYIHDASKILPPQSVVAIVIIAFLFRKIRMTIFYTFYESVVPLCFVS